jgi:hypothetical protein
VEVWEAFRQVKANQGAAGLDGQCIADFEADLKNNLFKVWNRVSLGTYFPHRRQRAGAGHRSWRIAVPELAVTATDLGQSKR